MPWPSPQDYAEAIQSPLVSLADPELQRGQVQLNNLGLPRCLSGAFATVFCMECESKKVAVRCFLSNIKEQEERYAEISKFVLADDLPYTVGFEYQKEGIQVRGEWYPILKMEWVEGETLGNYLEKVKEPDIFGMLAGYFKQMTLELQRAGISHGDLQHDNIMIHELELRLVDYDGMFVPSLAGRVANELGHRNYQHPARDSSFFNSSLDNFSAWVIWISLKCLALDTSLWKRMDAGGDCLLLRRTDFTAPESSRAIEILESHENEKIRRYAAVVRQLISMPIGEVPTLDNSLHQKVVLPSRPALDLKGDHGSQNETPTRFATDSDYDDQSMRVAVAEKESEQLPHLVVTESQRRKNLPVKFEPDTYYPSLSSLDLGVRAPGSFVDVESSVDSQLMPLEQIEWKSSDGSLKYHGPPSRARNKLFVLLMFLFVIPMCLGLLFGALPQQPLLYFVALLGSAIWIGLLFRPGNRTVYFLTNQRLIVATVGIDNQVFSIPISEFDNVKLHKYESLGSTANAEIHAKYIFDTPRGRMAYLTIDCPDSINFVRNMPKDVKVVEVIHASS